MASRVYLLVMETSAKDHQLEALDVTVASEVNLTLRGKVYVAKEATTVNLSHFTKVEPHD